MYWMQVTLAAISNFYLVKISPVFLAVKVWCVKFLTLLKKLKVM